MKPDSSKHNPDFVYLRQLIDKIGVSQREAARRIGISERSMRSYLADPSKARTADKCPYPVQFTLEALAAESQGEGKDR
jgi:predicted DNA-binding protein (UPF0251 family)